MPDAAISHLWHPIAAPPDPQTLGLPEMRALQKLWRVQRERIERHGAWPAFWQRMVRWWSIETGVIERVFDLSVGVTQILIDQGFVASLIPYGQSDKPADEVIQILKDHESSIGMIMDIVGGARELTVDWIKELHALICAHQETADAVTQAGQHVQIPLPRGTYKTHPNDPRRPDGSIHQYCPPEHVAAEMEHLVAIYEQLPAEQPEVRSAWLHHAFTSIHPFEDGNGRVARALASIDFIRAGMFPLLIDRADKQRGYWADLREPWEWVRLQLRDGGITDLVIVLHFIGNPSPGACVATAFMEHRTIREDEHRAGMIPLDTETLVLYPAEEAAPQSGRFASWLEEITKAALAVWINYL